MLTIRPALPLITALLASVAMCRSNAQEVSAFLEPSRVIEIAAAEMGILEHVYVQEGALVSPGEIVAQLNDDVLAGSLAISQAAVAAEGKLKLARAEVRDQEKKLAKLQALYARGSASQVELDRANSLLDMAQARLEQTEDEIRLKQLEIERTEQQIEQRRLRTPIQGIVVEVLKDTGEFVSISEPVIAKVVELNSLLAVFPVPQDAARNLQVGQRMPMTIGAERTQAEGTIEFVSPVTDAQSGTRRVKVRLGNADLQWPCGSICHLKGVLSDSPASPAMLTGTTSR